MRLIHTGALIVLLLGMVGCGFHLRGFALTNGAEALPFTTMYIEGTGGSTEALRKQISTFSGVQRQNHTQAAQTRITVLSEQTDKKILTVNRNGRVREYRLYLQVNYRVSYQGLTLLEDGQLRIFQDYSYNDSAVLAKESEQSMLIKSMYEDAANQILRRATALVWHAKNAPRPAETAPASAP